MTAVTLPAACPGKGWSRETGDRCCADRVTADGVDRCTAKPTDHSDLGLCNYCAAQLLGHLPPVAEFDPGSAVRPPAHRRPGSQFAVGPDGSVSTIAPCGGRTDVNSDGPTTSTLRGGVARAVQGS